MISFQSRSYMLSVLLRFSLYFLISGLCVLAALLSLDIQKFNMQKSQSRTQESLRLSLTARALQTDLLEAIDDVYTIASLQVLGDYISNPTQVNAKRVEKEFRNFAVFARVYDHIRFLDASGMERIRVNFNGYDAVPVARKNLQDKSQRYYFREASRIKPDALYISPMDLNIEKGRVERPYKPMIRFAKPVYSPSGKFQGVLVLNYLATIVLEDFRKFMSGSWGHTMMVNSNGHWLSSPDRKNEWGFMFGVEDIFARQNPKAWSYINSHDSGSVETAKGLFVFNTVRPYAVNAIRGAPLTRDRVAERYWKIITHVPTLQLNYSPLSVFTTREQELIGLLLIVGVLSAALAWVRTNYVTKALALRDSELHFRELIEQASDGIFIADSRGVYTDVNTAGCNMLGYSRDEIVGKAVTDFIISEDAWRMRREQDSLPEGVALVFDSIMLRKDGERLPVEISAKFLSGDRWQGIVRDISDRKRTEQQLQKYREQLEEMVALRTAALEATNKELETLTYSIAHDLRAPLRSITSFSQILQQDAGQRLNDQEMQDLQRIVDAGKYMARLVDDILALARISRWDFSVETVDLSQLASTIVAGIRQRYPRPSVRVDIKPGMKCNGDTRLMTIILENLLMNAWKFTGKRDDAYIGVGSMTNESGQVFYVRDNGVGFDMKYAHKLFSPFGRLHGAGEFEGAGIGLVAVQSAIKRHNGRVWFESVLGEGTTFYFTLNAQQTGNLSHASGSVNLPSGSVITQGRKLPVKDGGIANV